MEQPQSKSSTLPRSTGTVPDYGRPDRLDPRWRPGAGVRQPARPDRDRLAEPWMYSPRSAGTRGRKSPRSKSWLLLVIGMVCAGLAGYGISGMEDAQSWSPLPQQTQVSAPVTASAAPPDGMLIRAAAMQAARRQADAIAVNEDADADASYAPGAGSRPAASPPDADPADAPSPMPAAYGVPVPAVEAIAALALTANAAQNTSPAVPVTASPAGPPAPAPIPQPNIKQRPAPSPSARGETARSGRQARLAPSIATECSTAQTAMRLCGIQVTESH